MAVETLYELNQDKVIRNQLRLQEKAERDRISQEKASKAKAMTEGLAEGHAKGLAEGLAEGHAKGLAEGQMIAKKEIIKSLSANGFTASQISKMLNINEDFVEELLK